MTWYKVDDKLHSHKKAIKAGEAMALWVMAGSWAADQLSDGFVPDYVVLRMFPAQGEEWAERLVSVGLWRPARHDGDDGWAFHQWDDHQPTRAEVESKRETERDRKRRQRRNPGGQFEDSRRSPHGVPVGQDADTQRDSAPSHTVPTRPDPSHKNNAGYTDEFESWWKTYPSSANKAGAYKAYKAAAKKHDNLDGKLRAYLNARNMQERSGKFVPAIPNASTWLNQERWNDYGEMVTITRDNGQQVPEWSKAECDSILGGEDHWVPGSPPPGLTIQEERAWKQARAAEHLDERRQKAWEVMNSDRSAA